MKIVYDFRTKNDPQVFAQAIEYPTWQPWKKTYHVRVVAPWLCLEYARETCMARAANSLREAKAIASGIHKGVKLQDVIATKRNLNREERQ